MMNVSTLTVLLVCVISEYAHAASYQWGWERLQTRSKRSTQNGVSVVESWSSVCEEVCGAGYGGLGCNCDAETYTSVNVLLKTTLRGMCPILCENQLGTSKCDCPSNIGLLDNNKAFVERNRDRLCSATCQYTILNLKGCGSCSISTTTDSEISNDQSRSNSDSSEYEPNQSKSSNDKEDKTSEEKATTDEETPSEEDITTDESTTEESTTESTTTPSTTQPTTTKSTTPATTTPDWSQLCEALCRNGEGGSLCNCDIPPFF